jgi:hypothetical protein
MAEAKLKMWVPWSVLTNTPRGTVEEFRTLLKKYSPSSLLKACARLSVAFNYGPDGRTVADDPTTQKWIPELFAPQMAQKAVFFTNQGRPIFFQAQLRYLGAEVIRLDPQSNEDLPIVPNGMLGEILLRAGELLYKPHVQLTDDYDVMANLIAEFLPIYEITSPTDPFFQLLRFEIFLTIIIPKLAAKYQLFDVGVEFKKLFRFPIETYTNFIASFALRAQRTRSATTAPDAAIDASLRHEWFKNTTLTSEQIDQMFKTLSFELSDLSPQSDPVGYADFEFLRDRPYLSQNGEMFLLDYEFALTKLESAAVWRVLRSLPENKQLGYLSFWGYVFEEYIVWLFETYASKTLNVFYSSPTYEENGDTKQLCDAVIVCGSTAILVEAKLATCPVGVKYSGDYKKMKKYLEDKLVDGAPGRVGVSQLLNAVRTIVKSPEQFASWLPGITKIIPVIITKDDIGSSWVANAYLNKRFKSQLSNKKHRKYAVTPLVSMSISSLERLMWALKDKPFSEILEQRIKSDGNLASPFEAASDYVARGMAPKLHAHVEAFKTLAEKLVKDFGMKDEEVSQSAMTDDSVIKAKT